MTESLGSAALYLTVETTGMDAALTRAQSRIKSYSGEVGAAIAGLDPAMQKQAKRWLESADTASQARQQVIAYKAALAGMPTQIIDELKKRWAESARAADAAAKSANAVAIANTKAFSGSAKSARELQFAMRGLPAQITDIGVSLASGQKPLMVLLQQGGQLKDMFGGIGPAARALGGSIAAMVNPITLTAAAVGVLALALDSGQRRMASFAATAAKTGGFAGAADDIRATADAVDALGTVSSGSADKAAIAIAGLGKLTGDAAREATAATALWAAATGDDLSTIASKFADIANDPLGALDKLNQVEHFLTEVQRERIKVLIAEGRAQEAASEAARIYAAALTDSAAEVTASMTTAGRAIAAMRDAASDAWKGMVADASDAADAITVQMIELSDFLSKIKFVLPQFAGTAFYAESAAKAQRDALVAQGIAAGFDQFTSPGAVDSKASAAADAAMKALQSDQISLLSGEARYAAERAKKKKEINAQAVAADEAGLRDRAFAIRVAGGEVLAAMDKQFAEESKRSAGRVGGGRRSRGARAVRDFSRDDEAVRQRAIQDEIRATETFKDMAATLAGPLAAALREHERNKERLNDLAAKSPVAAAGLADALRDEEAAYEKTTAAIRRQLDPIGQLLEAQRIELDMIGKSNAERSVMNALLDDGIDLRSADAQAALAQARANQVEAESRQQQIDLMDDFRMGAEDALVSFITGAKSAKDALADFFNELAAQVTRAIAKNWMAQLFGPQGSGESGSSGGWLQSLLGAFLGGGNGAKPALSMVSIPQVPRFADGGYTGSGGRNEPAGIVHRGEYVVNADMVRRMGGPRAVESRMSGGGGHVTQNFTQVVQGNMTRKTAEQSARENGRQAARAMARTGR